MYTEVYVDVQNDVFKFFFEAAAGASLGAFFFFYLPFKLFGSLASSIKNRFGGRKDVKKTVHQG